MSKQKKLFVQKTKLGHGIIDGKLWFFYAYNTEEAAKAILTSFDNHPERIRVNITHAEPLQLVERH